VRQHRLHSPVGFTPDETVAHTTQTRVMRVSVGNSEVLVPSINVSPRSPRGPDVLVTQRQNLIAPPAGLVGS